MKKSGIYQIFNIKTGHVYIGQSVNIYARWRQHQNSLNSEKHDNKYLQSAWSKYGSEVFEFNILTECSKSDLLLAEVYWYNFYKETGKIYNLMHPCESFSRPRGESFLNSGSFKLGHSLAPESELKRRKSISLGRQGLKFSEKHRKNLSLSHKGKPSSNKGKKFSPEWRAKLSAARKAYLAKKKLEVDAAEA